MIGIVVNVLAVALGGLLGTVFSRHLSIRFTTELSSASAPWAWASVPFR